MRRLSYRLGVCVVLAICLHSQHVYAAASSATVMPNPVVVPDTILNATGMATGSLRANASDNVDIVIDTANCMGAGGGTFSITPSNNVAVGTTAITITVMFTPTSLGSYTCPVKINLHGGGSTNIGNFNVTGKGIKEQNIMVPASASFTAVRFNDAAPTHTSKTTITVQNTGDATLNVTMVSITGTNASDFVVTMGATMTTTPIAGSSAASWEVTFNPSAVGARTANIVFASNDPDTPNATVPLTGTGLAAVINVTDVPFGIVATGSSSSLPISVTNATTTNQGPLGVTSAMLSGGGGWFSFNGCTNPCTLNLSIPPMTGSVGVICSPPSGATGSQNATVAFTSDTDSGGTSTSNLSCTAGISQLSAAPSMVPAFGSQPLFTTSPTPQVVTITNTGNINASFYLRVTPAGGNMIDNGTFAVSNTATSAGTTGCGLSGTTNQCMLAPSATATFDISFTASAEGNLTGGVDIVSSGAFPQIALSGRGIDRHINSPMNQAFPDTFRNPGSKATIMALTIHNSGEDVLQVTSLDIKTLISGDATWTLVDPSPFSVPGGMDYGIMVRFAPTNIGKAFDGLLTITSNDRVNGTVMVQLSGNGKPRNVQLGPSSLDAGNTGAGVPTKLSENGADLLAVQNLDPDNDFTIARITFDSMPEGLFVLADGNGDSLGANLPKATTENFDIVFLPPAVGDYNGLVTLYLDEDPIPQQTIPIHGAALFVDAHGSGCQTGGGVGGGMTLVIGVLVFRRRRRVAA